MEKSSTETSSVTLLDRVESASKIVAFVAATIGALGALVQYRLNSEAEMRLRNLAELETDVKVSGLFSQLVQTANGYGSWSTPNDKIIEATLQHLPQNLLDEALRGDPRSIFALFTGSRVPEPVPLAAQVAAAESIVNLTIKYPFLRQPALQSFGFTICRA